MIYIRSFSFSKNIHSWSHPSLYLSLFLRPELVRAATTLYQHNLTGILETAVRATNAQFDSPEILKRLDVRLLEVLRRN